MNQRAVYDQWDGHRQIQQRQTVEDEDARLFRNGRDPVKDEQEQHEPENCIHGLNGEFGGREE